MCPPAIAAAPLFAASLAVSAVSGIASYIGQQQVAETQAEVQAVNNENLRRATIADVIQKGGDLNARQAEERTATAVRTHNAKLQAMEAKGTARATSESAGLSVDQLFADFDRDYLSFADAQMQQLGWNTDQINRSRESIQAQAKSRLNSGWDMTPIQGPSLLGTVAGIAGSGLNSYTQFSTRDPYTGKRSL